MLKSLPIRMIIGFLLGIVVSAISAVCLLYVFTVVVAG